MGSSSAAWWNCGNGSTGPYWLNVTQLIFIVASQNKTFFGLGHSTNITGFL